MKTIVPAALLLTAAACSSSGSPGSPAPGAALAYASPTNGSLTYVVGDTSVVTMDVMGNSMQVTATSLATVDLALERAGNGLDGTLTFQAVAGEISNPMAPSMKITDADKPGPTGMTVDPRGVVTVTSKPELSSMLAQALGSESYVRRMFVRLPGRAVTAGARWVDTVSLSEETAGMSTTGTTVLTSTLRGDTMVAGVRLLVIDSEAAIAQQVSGSNQGVEVRQTLTGTSTAVVLWDPALGALVARTETGTLSGSMELPAMGVSGLPVNIRQTQVIRLRR